MKSGSENPLPSTREILDRYGILAKKSFGQNFILDDNVTGKIVRLANITADDTVIEIGPGPGSLTKGLLAAAGKVIVIEKDNRFFAPLNEIGTHFPGKLEIMEADALKIDYESFHTPTLKLVSNLPYNISTPILVMLLKAISNFKSFTLMFQKEVAERITASPSTKEYGRLSVLVQWLCDVEKLYSLPPDVFTPKPKIHSAVLHFKPKANPIEANFEQMELVLKHAFGQRRKMLKGSLKGCISNPEATLKSCGIRPEARAEELSVAEFCKISREICLS